ncbi:RNA cap guanine-N2 methyltransferase-domain-containing protein [Irpex rosettiformis]|uniref:RNA cap guanine-N2 methyltransferase-domain-containing protein n=1 Tax=Irpex rosettiformis TaxID=378272 RepID=A0ACB8UBQ7_9APHY|nr:RNA cap guanine-N2 methyltransferase-domain-containing protein [Irpex rosettiformis]
MGKRHSAFTGLSCFALEAFGTNQGESSKPSTSPEYPPKSSNTAKKNTRSASDLDKESTTCVGEPSHKKRKTGLLGPGYEEYDATGLAPHYTDASEVPEHLKKYFFQRERYFSLYSSGCLLDEEGWYSVTPELIANQIAERCRCGTILDAFCGVGGNAIAFAQTCERVIAIDTSPIRLALARHNATIYGVQDRIEFIQADYLEFARSYLSRPSSSSQTRQRKIDVVFLSPPWGGPEYISGSGSPTHDQPGTNEQPHPEFNLASIQPIHGTELFKLTRKITPNVAYFLPRNTNLQEISNLLLEDASAVTEKGTPKESVQSSKQELVEVEEEWMGSKLKALTCYFGGLATGQEDLYEQDV